jgi:hypothetical protein
MFESALRSIDDTLWKDAGWICELDYIEQISWLLFPMSQDHYDQVLGDAEDRREGCANKTCATSNEGQPLRSFIRTLDKAILSVASVGGRED